MWSVLFVGLASARLAFVLVYWRSYASSPWTIFDIRDGGMNTTVGVAGAILMAVLLAVRHQAWRRPLLASLFSGLSLWVGMTTALDLSRPDTSLPAVVLPDLSGDQVALESFKGKPLVINLWATWCPPCRREMPVLQEAQKKHRDIAFIFANQGESPAVVRNYLGAAGLRLDNVLVDQAGSVAKHVGAAGLPSTLFFDRDGSLVETRVGELSSASLEQRLGILQRP